MRVYYVGRSEGIVLIIRVLSSLLGGVNGSERLLLTVGLNLSFFKERGETN